MPVTINGTTGIAGVDGSNTTPAIKGGTSTGTGVFYGTNTVSLATGGTTAVTVDSSQNVGIGTASPASALCLGNVKTLSWLNASGSYNGTTTGTQILKFSDNNLYVDNLDASSNIIFRRNGPTESARIDSSGRFLMPAANLFDGVTMMQLDASAAARAALGIKAGTNNYCQTFFAYNNASLGGSITTSGTTTTFGTSSDYRLKENVQPMSGALSRIEQLHPVTYNWKADGSLGEGFIAHELQTVIPLSVIGEKDAVTEDGNIAPQQVDYAKLTPILTAAIQELSAKLDAATARIAALEAK